MNQKLKKNEKCNKFVICKRIAKTNYSSLFELVGFRNKILTFENKIRKLLEVFWKCSNSGDIQWPGSEHQQCRKECPTEWKDQT